MICHVVQSVGYSRTPSRLPPSYINQLPWPFLSIPLLCGCCVRVLLYSFSSFFSFAGVGIVGVRIKSRCQNRAMRLFQFAVAHWSWQAAVSGKRQINRWWIRTSVATHPRLCWTQAIYIVRLQKRQVRRSIINCVGEAEFINPRINVTSNHIHLTQTHLYLHKTYINEILEDYCRHSHSPSRSHVWSSLHLCGDPPVLL